MLGFHFIMLSYVLNLFISNHPFYGGNGRTDRIINILYFIKQDLLQHPIL
jgi:Fic family protein